MLLFRGVEFPLTHDIEELLKIAEDREIKVPEDIEEADQLTPYAVETRYPGYLVPITEEDVKNALRIAEQTLAWAKDELSRERGENK